MHSYCSFLYIILTFFLSPYILLSFPDFLSSTCNLYNQSTQPSTTNHTKTHHHNITIHNNLTTKSTKNQTHPHMDTPIEIERALLRTCGYVLVLGSWLERASMLMEEIRVFGLTRMNLCACGLVLVTEKDTCGGIRVWAEGEMSDFEVERERLF